MEQKNSLGELMKITMEHIKTMADANTIIGTPIHAEGVTLIPVSRMSFGMGVAEPSFPPRPVRPRRASAAAPSPVPSWSRWPFWWSGRTAV